jgi:hypothetical protein
MAGLSLHGSMKLFIPDFAIFSSLYDDYTFRRYLSPASSKAAIPIPHNAGVLDSGTGNIIRKMEL